MRVVSLASGSSGNALLIEAGPGGRSGLLIDAGLPGPVLVERLRKARMVPGQLSGVLITHEHSDHILGLSHLLKRYKVPALADQRTLSAIKQMADYAPDQSIEDMPDLIAHHSTSFPIGSYRKIGDIDVYSFPVSHDAVAPCGYLLNAGGCRVCVVIDTGEITESMLEAMSQADLLALESNHDRERLLRGPYPYHLKQRILSSTGHLSNDQAADGVLRTWRSDGVRWLWLSHLSRTNNTPRLALETMRTRISEARADPAQIHISVLPPGMGSEWDSRQLWQERSLWEMHY